jgi:hypothetical protein
VIVDAERVDEQRVYGEVDDEADAADDAEAYELQPVGRLAHSVHEAHVRLHLDGGADVAGVYVHGGGVVAHRCRLSERGLAPCWLGGVRAGVVLRPLDPVRVAGASHGSAR